MANLGFIGLGIMGLPMAGHLIAASHTLHVYDLNPEPVRELASRGAVACSSSKEVAQESDMIITIVPDTPDEEAVLFGKDGVAEGLRPGTILVDMSSISPIATKEFARKLEVLGARMLDAPVSGGQVGAQNATLSIMVGGPSDLFDQVKNTPLLILDGLGTHSTTPWADEKLFQIINHRYNAQLPTVITVAGDLDELDPYVLSRLRSPGFSRVAELFSAGHEQSLPMGGIEPRLLKVMTFDNFDKSGNNNLTATQRVSLETARKAAINFADDPDGWLTFSGETGVGKTHLAIAIAGKLMKNGHSVFFAFVPDLMDYLRDTFNPESVITYDRLFDDVKNSELLILDDFGQERRSDWAVEKLYQIVVHRHNARLPTVITSMLGFTDELDPITSRVQDPSVSDIHKIDAPDYRNKRRQPRGQGRSGGARRRGSPGSR